MRVYEVVKDHKSGMTKVVSYEERRDPFSRPSIMRYGEDRRARIASLKALWVTLRTSWRDRELRLRIAGNALFFVALCVFPCISAFVAIVEGLLHSGAGYPEDFVKLACVLFGALGIGSAIFLFGAFSPGTEKR